MPFTPTLFTRNGQTRIAYSISEYMRLKFDGWTPDGAAPVPPAAQPSVKTVNGKPGPEVSLAIADIPGLTAALADAGLDAAEVQGIVSGLLTGAPAAYDTLLEIANAMAADDSAAAALVATVAGKANTTDVNTSLAGKVGFNVVDRQRLSLVDYSILRPFWAALANRRNQSVPISFNGDSTVEGYRLTNYKDVLPLAVARAFRDRFPIDSIQQGRGFIGVQNDLVNNAFWPEVYTGTAPAAAGYGPNFRTMLLSGAGQKLVRTLPPGGITGGWLYFYNFYTGSNAGYIKADGGAPIPFTANGGAFLTPTRVALPAAASTIEIGWTSGVVYISGLDERYNDENAGVVVHNFGMGGSQLSDWNAGAIANEWPTAIAAFSPELDITQIGANDARVGGGNKTAATFQADLEYHLTAKHAFGITCPKVISMTHSLGDSGLREPWANYVAAARAAAANRTDTIVIDHSARMLPSDQADPAGLYNAAYLPHGTAKGYSLYAATLVAELSPR